MIPANSSLLVLIRRRLTGKFTQIPNDLIRNSALSSKVLGVIVYLLCLPPNFRISLEGLCRARNEGETAMRTAIQQLERLNYMKIVRERSESGRFVRSRWIVSDEPILDWAPYLGNSAVEERAQDQPTLDDQGPTNTKFVEIPMNFETTTTPPPHSVSNLPEIGSEADEEIWLWLCQKLTIEPQKARQDCAGLSAAVAMDVLAEVVECKRQGGIRKSVPQFMSSLLRKAREGTFNLSAGASLRKAIPQILQNQKALHAAAAAPPFLPDAVPAMTIAERREKLRQVRNELARTAHEPRLTGGSR